jgi:small-conductance mechanosensitive channel
VTIFHRTAKRITTTDLSVIRRSHLRFATFTFLVAVAAFAVAGASGNIHGTFNERLFAGFGGGGFVVAGVLSTRAAALEVYEVVGARTGPSHAGILRWLVTIVGYIIVMLSAFGLFSVPIGHLVLGGALTGVIVGIALQQALGNIFAGMVLLLARPFSIGDAIVVRSGTVGGPLEGTVTGMGMTYVTLLTDDGALSVPNSGMLAAAVGPLPGTGYTRHSRVGIGTPSEIRDMVAADRS